MHISYINMYVYVNQHLLPFLMLTTSEHYFIMFMAPIKHYATLLNFND